MTSTNEYFKAVPGFPALQVSNIGRVRSFARPDKRAGLKYRVLSPGLCGNGHLTVFVKNDDGVRTSQYVHVLQAAAFLGPKPAGQLVRHLNDVKTDNRVENIAYGTYSDNLLDAYRNGRRVPKRGPRNAPVVQTDLPLAA